MHLVKHRSRVDEKRQDRFPNSNLGVGRVGKWAQCGVTLRAFALSPPTPSPTMYFSIAPTFLRCFALLHLSPFTVNEDYCFSYRTSCAKSFQHYQPSTCSKPDQPSLIDLLILLIAFRVNVIFSQAQTRELDIYAAIGLLENTSIRDNGT